MKTLTLTNALIASCEKGHSNDYGLLPGLWAVIIRDGKIEQLTPMEVFKPIAGATEKDLAGKLVTPGLIDCHTHLVFGGDRVCEWEMRLQGRSYAEIAKAGGGILSTVEATRKCSEDQLFEQALRRLHAIASEGVTCVEIKSGYGLTLDDELKTLRVVQKLKATKLCEISPTLLAAHTIPVEYKSDPDAYVTVVCDTIIPQVAHQRLAEAVDVFCEPIAFSLAQCERIFTSARKHGLAIKAHAEQLSYTGCAKRAAQQNAWSVDHIEYLPAADIEALKKGQTVAVVLPGAFYALREKQAPPIAELRRAGVPIALATDCNPGTSPFTSIRMMMNLACVLFGLTPAEALSAVTREAAVALGRGDRLGTITLGKDATVCVWDTQQPAAIISDLTHNPLHCVIIQGEERNV
jgi:imidazolonepropionase